MKPQLIATAPSPDLQQQMIRMMRDTVMLEYLRPAEVRGIYDELEAMRDRFSQLLDKADNKHV